MEGNKIVSRLPRITAAQLVAVLNREGWIKVRQSGSHMTFYHPKKSGLVIVPRHGNIILKPGTLKSALKQAGLTVDELIRLLRG
jgi:predicted RNA binding protein YcfA (HicA-like mRNA interferase family)